MDVPVFGISRHISPGLLLSEKQKAREYSKAVELGERVALGRAVDEVPNQVVGCLERCGAGGTVA